MLLELPLPLRSAGVSVVAPAAASGFGPWPPDSNIVNPPSTAVFPDEPPPAWLGAAGVKSMAASASPRPPNAGPAVLENSVDHPTGLRGNWAVSVTPSWCAPASAASAASRPPPWPTPRWAAAAEGALRSSGCVSMTISLPSSNTSSSSMASASASSKLASAPLAPPPWACSAPGPASPRRVGSMGWRCPGKPGRERSCRSAKACSLFRYRRRFTTPWPEKTQKTSRWCWVNSVEPR